MLNWGADRPSLADHHLLPEAARIEADRLATEAEDDRVEADRLTTEAEDADAEVERLKGLASGNASCSSRKW
jgi:hypothetical protein